MNSELGSAQNPDGTLKEPHEITWRHSCSPSPGLLLTKPPAHIDALPKPPGHGKAPKLKTQNRRKHDPLAKEAAKPEWRKGNQLTLRNQLVLRDKLALRDKLTIIEFEEEAKREGRKLTQTAIAMHFLESKIFEGLCQTTVGDILRDRKLIRAALDPKQSGAGSAHVSKDAI
jgi:hypothetical protein